METIKGISCAPRDQQKPYQTPLKAVLATRSDIITYKEDDSDKPMMYLALCDTTGHIKAVLYEPNKVAKTPNGTTIIIKNYFVRPDNTVALTSQTKIFQTSPLEVDNSVLTQAVNSVRPATPPRTPIEQIKSSPVKSMTSVVDIISQNEIPRQVMVRGEQVPLRTITLSQDASSIKVSLWRKESEMPFQCGECVKMTNLVVKTYMGEKQLSGSTRTTIQKTHMPPQETEGQLEGFIQEENHIELLFTDAKVAKISTEVLSQGLDTNEEEWRATLETLLPFKAKLTIQDGEAISFMLVNIQE